MNIIDPHGVPFTREDFRYEDSAFISNFTLGLQEGATEFTLTVRLQQKDGKAPRPDQFPVIIESIDFNFAAAP